MGKPRLAAFLSRKRTATIHPTLVRVADFLAQQIPEPKKPKSPKRVRRIKRKRRDTRPALPAEPVPAEPASVEAAPTERSRRAQWVEAFLSAYAELPEGGLRQLTLFVLRVLEHVLRVRVPEGHERGMVELAIQGIKEKKDVVEEIHAILCVNPKSKAWYAYYACHRENPDDIRLMLVYISGLLATPAVEARREAIRKRRLGSDDRKSFQKLDIYPTLKETALRAGGEFYYWCMDELLSLARTK